MKNKLSRIFVILSLVTLFSSCIIVDTQFPEYETNFPNNTRNIVTLVNNTNDEIFDFYLEDINTKEKFGSNTKYLNVLPYKSRALEFENNRKYICYFLFDKEKKYCTDPFYLNCDKTIEITKDKYNKVYYNISNERSRSVTSIEQQVEIAVLKD